MLDSAITGDTSKQHTAGTAAAAAAGRRGGRRAAAAGGGGGGGGGPEDSDHDMTDADGAHGDENRGPGGATPGGANSSELLPTPGMAGGSGDPTPMGGRTNMRARVSSYLPTPSEGVDAEGNQRIWGTHFRRRDMETMIWRFLTTFSAAQQDAAADSDGMSTYTHLLRQMMLDGHVYLNIDAAHIQQSSPRLLTATIEVPDDLLNLWEVQLNKLAGEQADVLGELGVDQPLDKLQVRIFNLDDVRPIRDLDPIDIDSLVAIRGMVTRTGNIIPDLRLAVFRCEACGAEASEVVVNGIIAVPPQCSAATCGRKQTLRIIPNRCAYANRQIIKVQEDPSNIPEGETPRSLLMYAFDTNVDACKPGDKVTVTGVFRATRMRLNPRQRAAHALFKTYIDVVHVDKEEGDKLFKQRTGAEDEVCADGTQTQGGPDVLFSSNITRQQLLAKEEKFKAMAADPQHYSKLVASVAPRVIDMDNVKAGLLCQLFGGVCKSTAAALGGNTTNSAGSSSSNSSKGSIRGDINILVVGDPSVSKSQLLGFIHHVAPRGIYTSGKGSSAVGLTAYVTRDPETNEMVLESGALVLSDRGICCIDEFDKMSDGARAMLHEVMEQQTVSVAKAGLVSQLNARTSILACANPKGSRYIPEMSLSENINLPPTLLSRFDLVYLVLDKRDEDKDRRLAKHLVSLFWADAPEAAQPPYSPDLLREFVAYARARVSPTLTPAAEVRLVESYKDLRRQCSNEKNGRVAATPRQLEAMIRISEALARMHLRNQVTEDDVRSAYRLWFDALSGSAADEEGRLDMNLLTAGTSARHQNFISNELPLLLRSILTELFKSCSSVTLAELYSTYMQTFNEQKRRQQQQQLGGGQQQQPEGPQYRSISQGQMQMAVMQLNDLVNLRGGVLTRKGAAAGSGDGAGAGAEAAAGAAPVEVA